MTDIGGHWYIGKWGGLSKTAQEKNDKIKQKLHTANSNWYDWKLQLHWNKLEWFIPRSKNVRKTYSTSSKKFYIEQKYRTSNWVVH